MKIRGPLLFVLLAFVISALVWWSFASPTALPPTHVTLPVSKTPNAYTSTPPPKPTKLFQFNHQPTNPEEQAIWDWWFYMDKHDPDFQWRTPIEFYGRVLDQHGQPVAGAKVKMVWSTIGTTPERNIFSDNDGRFQITDIQGKGISVTVSALGYTAGGSTNKSFEYSAFFEPHYNVPHKDDPVLFQLWKLEEAEPMYFWNKLNKMTINGQKVWFDTKTGNFGAAGDIAFSTTRGTTYAPRQFDWSLTIEAAPGGGIALHNEELMFEAPQGGYQQSWTQDIGGKDESYTINKVVKFYLKTPDEKYAAMQADITHMTIPEAEVNLSAYINPSGSRNLQYDTKKRIAPK